MPTLSLQIHTMYYVAYFNGFEMWLNVLKCAKCVVLKATKDMLIWFCIFDIPVVIRKYFNIVRRDILMILKILAIIFISPVKDGWDEQIVINVTTGALSTDRTYGRDKSLHPKDLCGMK